MNIRKKRIILIFFLYFIHLVLYVIILNFAIEKMTILVDNLERLNKDFNLSDYHALYLMKNYNHIYLTIYYLILSTYFIIKSLGIYIPKLIGFSILVTGFIFAIVAIYLYYSVTDFVNMYLLVNGLILSLNMFYKRINLHSMNTIQ